MTRKADDAVTNAAGPVQPEGLSGLDLAAYLANDTRLMTRCRLALLARCRVVAMRIDDYARARMATDLLHGGPSFDAAFRLHYYPALLAGGIDHYSTDAALADECDEFITALAEVPPPPLEGTTTHG